MSISDKREIFDAVQEILQLFDDIDEHKQHIKLDREEIVKLLHKIQERTM